MEALISYKTVVQHKLATSASSLSQETRSRSVTEREEQWPMCHQWQFNGYQRGKGKKLSKYSTKAIMSTQHGASPQASGSANLVVATRVDRLISDSPRRITAHMTRGRKAC